MQSFKWAVPGIAAAIAACGGSTTSVSVPSSGIFTDSPVAGLHYTTGGRTGTTGADGGYTCDSGNSVVFTIGNLALPAVVCAVGANVITPMTLFATADLTDTRVVHLAQLLQTLDSDGDPTNGITLDPAVYAANVSISGLNFSDAGFEADASLGAFLTQVKGSTAVVPGATALAHVQSQTLVGTWTVGDPAQQGNVLALTFFSDGSYMLAQDGNPEGDAGQGQSGVEHGTYTWDPLTGAFTATASMSDTDGQWGLSNPTVPMTITIAGDTLTLSSGTAPGPVTAARVLPDAANALVGTWYIGDPALQDDLFVMTFYANGTYVMGEDGDAVNDTAGQDGMEHGTYTWDSGTGAFSATAAMADTNGQWGLSNPRGRVTMIISGNTLTRADTLRGSALAARVMP